MVESPCAGSTVPAQSQDASASRVTLKASTPVQLRFTRAIASSQVIAGDKVDLEVTADVRVGNLIVIPKYSLAQAIVTIAQAKRTMARGGYMELKIETVRLGNGETAPLRMTEDVKGGGHKGTMIAGMVVVGIVDSPAAQLFMYVQGKDAVIPRNAEVTAYVNGDDLLDPAKFGPGAAESQPIPEAAAPTQDRSVPR